MPKRSCVLSVYPLTRAFKPRVAALAGSDGDGSGAAGDHVTWLTLGEIRPLGIVGMARKLRSLAIDEVLLPVESEDDMVLVPLLQLIAGVTRASKITVVHPDLKTETVTRLDSAKAAAQLGKASVEGFNAIRRARRDVAELLKAPRRELNRPEQRDVLFLNANLWFGVKAGGSVGHISGVVNGFLDEQCPVQFASVSGRLMTRPEAAYTQLQPGRHMGMPWENNYQRFNYRAIEQVQALIARHPVGLIYQRLSLGNFTGVAVSRALGLPLIMEYNGSEAWVAKNWGRPLREQALAEQIEAANFRHAHMMVTISDVLRDELRAHGVPAERIVSYPNCIDPTIFDPARFPAADVQALRKELGIAPDAVVVTFLGTFGQWHGTAVLAQAIAQLFEQHGAWAAEKKVHFLLVGDGVQMPDVKAALGRFVDSPHVTLAGLVPQARAPLYLAASDILSSPHVPNADGSRFFGSPTKLFEYMAMGKPILASDLDQIGDVLADSLRVEALPPAGTAAVGGEVAVLATPGSVPHIVAGLQFLVDSPHVRHQLGTNVRQLALGKYTWQKHVRAILDRAEALGLAKAAG